MPNSTLIVKYALFHNVDFPIVKLRMNLKDFGNGRDRKERTVKSLNCLM